MCTPFANNWSEGKLASSTFANQLAPTVWVAELVSSFFVQGESDTFRVRRIASFEIRFFVQHIPELVDFVSGIFCSVQLVIYETVGVTEGGAEGLQAVHWGSKLTHRLPNSSRPSFSKSSTSSLANRIASDPAGKALLLLSKVMILERKPRAV